MSTPDPAIPATSGQSARHFFTAVTAVTASGCHHREVPRNFHLERYPGKYVAIDLATDEVVLTADTPQAWEEHVGGRFDRSAQLWSVLMLEAWREAADR